MKRIEFTCDGCDSVSYSELPSDGKFDSMVVDWISHRVVCYENGAAAREISVDLCAGCTDKFRHAINPANWPRMSAEVRKFAKR